jgi:hypothetical protein
MPGNCTLHQGTLAASKTRAFPGDVDSRLARFLLRIVQKRPAAGSIRRQRAPEHLAELDIRNEAETAGNQVALELLGPPAPLDPNPLH